MKPEVTIKRYLNTAQQAVAAAAGMGYGPIYLCYKDTTAKLKFIGMIYI